MSISNEWGQGHCMVTECSAWKEKMLTRARPVAGKKPDRITHPEAAAYTRFSSRWNLVVFSGRGHMGTSWGDGNAVQLVKCGSRG